MSADHLVWRATTGGKYCVLKGLSGVRKQYEVKRGVSRANGWPDDAHFKMDEDYPKQVALADNLSNMDDIVVVSNTLKELVEGRAPPSLEILPVRVINHKGRDAGAPFWILSPLAVVDCIDLAASNALFGALNPAQIVGLDRLVLDPARIPADLPLFRAKNLELRVLVRRDLADAIVAEGFTGLLFAELASFKG